MAQPPSSIEALVAEMVDKSVCVYEDLATRLAAEYQAKLDSMKETHDHVVAGYQFRLSLDEIKLTRLSMAESKLEATNTRVQRYREALYANRQVIGALLHIDRAKDALLEIERSRNAGSRPTMTTRQSGALHELAEQLPNLLVILEKAKQEAAELERAAHWA